MSKKGIQQEAVFPVYKVDSQGISIEYTPDLKSAEGAFSEAGNRTDLWEVQADGSAKLLKRKL